MIWLEGLENYIVQAFSIIFNVIVLYFFNKYSEGQKKDDIKQKSFDKGMRSLLKKIIFDYCTDAIRRGHTTLEELENITDMYEAYNGLCGNVAVEAIYKKYLTLPTFEIK